MKKIIVVVLSLFLMQRLAAHSGRTNSSGCHNNRKTGGYHCHGGGSHSSPSHFNKLIKMRELSRLGYEIGKADGIMGNKTRKAIEAFQIANDLAITGVADSELLEQLKTKSK